MSQSELLNYQIIIQNNQRALTELRDYVTLMTEALTILLLLLLFINILIVFQLKQFADRGIKHYVLIDDLNANINAQLHQRTTNESETRAPEDITESDPTRHESEGKED